MSAAMDKIRPDEVINFFEYEKVRDARRASVIELKRRRRVSVGRYVSLVFENRETVLFQIQEMCRAERIADDAKVREEIDVYNALLPGPRELSATLFIEIEDMARIQPILDQLMGIDTGQCVWLQVGREFAVPGEFEAGHSDATRASSPRCTSSAFASPPRRRARSARPRCTW